MLKTFAQLALGLSLVSATGCDLIKSRLSPDSESETKEDKKARKKKGAAGAGCEAPTEPIQADFTIAKDCQVEINHALTVQEGATLTIEAGAELAFGSDGYLYVEKGKLEIKGTEKKPVKLTSASKTKAKGDWAGIYIAGDVSAGTRIENARIEYAGRDAHGGQGAITLVGQNNPKRVAIVSTVFEENDRAAISVEGDRASFAELRGNKFSKGGRSLVAPAHVLGSIGEGNTFGDPLETRGDVAESATWPAFGAPVYVTSSLRVIGPKSAATLTLAKGTELRFVGDTYFSVGEDGGGSLIAPGCTFTSASDAPSAGDWVGFFLYKATGRIDLAGSTIVGAGHDAHGGRGAITLYDVEAKDLRNASLSGLTVKNTRGGAIASPNNDCEPLAAQVRADGVPACRPE